MERAKSLMITIASFACTSLLLLSGCTGTLETKGTDDAPSASERQQALLDACDNKQGGDACTVEFRGREIFSGTCVDTDLGTRCLTDDAASAVEGIKSKARNKRNNNGQNGADAGSGNADAGNQSGNTDAGNQNGNADAGNQNGGNRNTDAGNQTGGNGNADAGNQNGGNGNADAGNQNGDAAPNNAGNQNASGGGAKDDLDLTEACEGKADGDACTVSVNGREVYSGSCKFGFCVP